MHWKNGSRKILSGEKGFLLTDAPPKPGLRGGWTKQRPGGKGPEGFGQEVNKGGLTRKRGHVKKGGD